MKQSGVLPPYDTPHFAVVFSSQLSKSADGYKEIAERMLGLAKDQAGYLGVESARDENGLGITVSYWESQEAILAWKKNSEHLDAQIAGREKFYDSFTTRVCRVEREYGFSRPVNTPVNTSALPEFQTERLLIRHMSFMGPKEMAAYWERNHRKFAPINPPLPADFLTESHWTKRIDDSRKEFVNGSSARFVLTLKDRPSYPIGAVSFTNVARGPQQSCNLGYTLDGSEEGKGFMNEALTELIQFAFNNLKLHRVHASYLPENARSAKVLHKLGFTIEGHAKDYLFIDGAWRDHVLTSKTNPHFVTPQEWLRGV